MRIQFNNKHDNMRGEFIYSKIHNLYIYIFYFSSNIVERIKYIYGFIEEK